MFAIRRKVLEEIYKTHGKELDKAETIEEWKMIVVKACKEKGYRVVHQDIILHKKKGEGG